MSALNHARIKELFRQTKHALERGEEATERWRELRARVEMEARAQEKLDLFLVAAMFTVAIALMATGLLTWINWIIGAML